MSFQNSGTTPDGQVFYRGDAILVEHLSHLLSGRVSEISIGDGGEVIIFPTVDQGVLNTMGGDATKNVPDTAYLGQGFLHQSTKQVRGEKAEKPENLFCFAHETPTFAMGGAAAAPAEVVQSAPSTEGNDPGKTAPLPVTATPKGQVDRDLSPADKNKDGVVSPKEAKEFKKNRPTG